RHTPAVYALLAEHGSTSASISRGSSNRVCCHHRGEHPCSFRSSPAVIPFNEVVWQHQEVMAQQDLALTQLHQQSPTVLRGGDAGGGLRGRFLPRSCRRFRWREGRRRRGRRRRRGGEGDSRQHSPGGERRRPHGVGGGRQRPGRGSGGDSAESAAGCPYPARFVPVGSGCVGEGDGLHDAHGRWPQRSGDVSAHVQWQWAAGGRRGDQRRGGGGQGLRDQRKG
ncbi:unnamed protein product, partial [Ectocarpus sp. 4 AP-2014]